MGGGHSKTSDKGKAITIVRNLQNAIRLKQKGLENLENFSLTSEGSSRCNFSVNSKRKKIEFTRGGKYIPEKGLDEMAKHLAENTKLSEQEAYNIITRNPYSQRAVNYFLAILSAGLIFFGLSKANLTGAVIDISNQTSNIGIFVCIAGIIGLTIYIMKLKEK